VCCFLFSAGVKLGDHDPMNANLYVGTSSLFAASLGKEMPFLEPFYVKTIILPRQAWDKHWEKLENWCFLRPRAVQGCFLVQLDAALPGQLETNAQSSSLLFRSLFRSLSLARQDKTRQDKTISRMN
jgi:hypothetical protein